MPICCRNSIAIIMQVITANAPSRFEEDFAEIINCSDQLFAHIIAIISTTSILSNHEIAFVLTSIFNCSSLKNRPHLNFAQRIIEIL